MDDLKLYAKSEDQIDSLIHSVRIFTDDIKMEFGLSKCAMIVLKRGKLFRSEGIKMPDGEVLKSLEETGMSTSIWVFLRRITSNMKP